MPLYEITDPKTGKVLELEGDSPPTEQELEQIFSAQQLDPVDQEIKDRLQAQQPVSQAEPSLNQRIGSAIESTNVGKAASELASAINRGAVNIVDFLGPDTINSGLSLIGSEKRVPSLKDSEFIQKATEGNAMEPGLTRRAVRTAGEFVAPSAGVGSVIRGVAQAAPKIGASVTQKIAQTMASKPLTDVTAAATAGAGSEIGADVGEAAAGDKGRSIGRLVGGFGAPIGVAMAKEAGKTLITKSAKKLLTESAPTIDGLKKAARSVYRDLENSGVNINSSSIGKLAGSLSTLAKQKGFHRKIHKEVDVALTEFKRAAESGLPLKLSELDALRQITAESAKSIKPSEARLGGILVTRVDDFLDSIGKNELSKTSSDIGAKYRDARQLWRRVKKSEQLSEVFDKAQLQATGFENGIRTQFRSILNSKKQRKGFTPDEIIAMRKVVEGTSLQNIAKMLGRFGFGEGQASNMLMGYAGIAGGAVVGGPVGAVFVPSIGQLSRKLAQRLTREGGKNADLIIKAGKNGLDIVKAYMKITPAKQRSAKELTELLLRPDISLESLKIAVKNAPQQHKQIVNDAAFLVNAIKSTQEKEQ